AEGSLRDGLSLLEQAIAYSGDAITDAQVRELLGVVAESVLDELVVAIETQSAERALGLVHRLIGDGQNLQHFCREAIRHVRNLLVAKVCGADSELVTVPSDERERLGQQAERFSEEDLTRFFNILLATDDDLRRKPDPRLHLEMGLLRLINAQKLAPLEEVLAEMRSERNVQPHAKHQASEYARVPSATAPPANSSAKSAAASSTAAGGGMAPVSPSPSSGGFASVGPARISTAAPMPIAPSRIMARPAEEADGLAGARLEAIKAALHESKLLSSFLEHATRCEIEASEFRLFFTTEHSALAEMLPREAMERLRTAVHQVIGQPLRVCVKLDPARTLTARGSELRARFEEDPVVRAMLEKFGGQISRIKRPGEE
ncbi:MAG: hypothetical protein ACRD3B_14910, partial [Candidatus Sulfotelmatobacter sp.]